MIAGGVTTLDYWMLSRPEMKTAEQLKGDTVAISRFGSASDFQRTGYSSDLFFYY